MPSRSEDPQRHTFDILPVERTKAEGQRVYDRISVAYDLLTWGFERQQAERALRRLAVREGERVLEIGFGTGRCLRRLAVDVGGMGRAFGVDMSSGMIAMARRRLRRTGLSDRVELVQADAARLPIRGAAFDAVFMSFTLELFDTPEIPIVLSEIRRVLREGGRFGVVSLSREDGETVVLRLYEWAHSRWPKYIDCRPIYVAQSIAEAGFEIKEKTQVGMLGLSGEIVIATKRPR